MDALQQSRGLTRILWHATAALSLGVGLPARAITYNKVALSDDLAPGAGGAVYSGYFGTRPSLNNAGDAVFIAGLELPGGGQSEVLFGPSAGAGSALSPLFAPGDPAPGYSGGATISYFTQGATINNAGQVAFIAEVSSPTQGFLGKAIFGPSGGAGSTTTVRVRPNDPALGVVGNSQVLPRDDGSQAAINDAGQIGFFMQVGATNIETLFGPNAWGTGFVQLTSENDTPPGVPADRRYEIFIEASTFLTTGEVAYEALLEYNDDQGRRRVESHVFAASELGVRRLGPANQIGDPVPGRDDGAVFTSSTSALSVNEHGDIMFYRGFTDSSGQVIRGLFAPTNGPGSEYGLVLQTHIPRVFDGEVLEITGTGPSSMNNNADFAMVGSFVIDPEAPFPGDRGDALFTVIDGRMQLIAKQGKAFDVDPGPGEDLRVITNIGIASDSFNDANQVLFELEFEDGTSGLFIATVPEPGTAALLAGLGLATLARRRQRA